MNWIAKCLKISSNYVDENCNVVLESDVPSRMSTTSPFACVQKADKVSQKNSRTFTQLKDLFGNIASSASLQVRVYEYKVSHVIATLTYLPTNYLRRR